MLDLAILLNTYAYSCKDSDLSPHTEYFKSIINTCWILEYPCKDLRKTALEMLNLAHAGSCNNTLAKIMIKIKIDGIEYFKSIPNTCWILQKYPCKDNFLRSSARSTSLCMEMKIR